MPDVAWLSMEERVKARGRRARCARLLSKIELWFNAVRRKCLADELDRLAPGLLGRGPLHSDA